MTQLYLESVAYLPSAPQSTHQLSSERKYLGVPIFLLDFNGFVTVRNAKQANFLKNLSYNDSN